MDAATRAELEALRRRAYGPDGDLHRDPEALERLGELEDRARGSAVSAGSAGSAAQTASTVPARPEPLPELTPAPPSGAVESVEAAESAEAVPTATTATAEPSTTVGPGRAAARPPVLRTALFGVAVVTAAVIVGTAVWSSPDPSTAPEISPTRETQVTAVPALETPALTGIGILSRIDPGAAELLRITLDGSFGNFVDLPLDGDAPVFPTPRRLEWAAPLGVYYGWDLWIAGGTGAEDDDYCLLIRREEDVRANCAPASLRRYGALQVSVAAADIDPQERPAQMTDEQRIGFWWLDGGAVEVVLGTFDAGAFDSSTVEVRMVDGDIVKVERRDSAGDE